MSRLVEEALAAVDGVIQHAMPEFEHLFSPEGETMEDAFHNVLEMPEFDLDSPALILHSSGMRFCLPERPTLTTVPQDQQTIQNQSLGHTAGLCFGACPLVRRLSSFAVTFVVE